MNLWTNIISLLGFPHKSQDSELTQRKFRLLIVDDAVENRMLLEVMVERAGFEHVSCSGGEEAVQLAQEQDFDAILMDIYMPIMDGIEATIQIKQQERNLNTPIIAVTAADSDEERIRRIEAGVDDYVAKPVNPANLIKHINKNIAQSGQVKTAENGDDIFSTMCSDPTYKKVIKIFVKSLPGRIKDIRKAFDSDDMEVLAKRVHSLKGTGGMAGFWVYTHKAKQLEAIVKSENPDRNEINEKIQELEFLLKKTKKNCR